MAVSSDPSFIARNLEVLVDGLSGATGGLISSLIFHPLENIRTRLQDTHHQQSKEIELDQTPGNKEDKKLKRQFNAWLHIMTVFKREGFKGFYKGIETTLFGSVLSFGIYFFLYRLLKRAFIL
jgi:hypothetical protein